MIWPRSRRGLPVVAAAVVALAAGAAVRAQSIVGSLTLPGWQPRSVAVHQATNHVFVGDHPTGEVYTFDAESRRTGSHSTGNS